MSTSATTVFGIKVSPSTEIAVRTAGTLICLGVLAAVGQQIHAHLELGKVEQGLVYGGLVTIGIAATSVIWIPWLMRKSEDEALEEERKNVRTADL